MTHSFSWIALMNSTNHRRSVNLMKSPQPRPKIVSTGCLPSTMFTLNSKNTGFSHPNLDITQVSFIMLFVCFMNIQESTCNSAVSPGGKGRERNLSGALQKQQSGPLVIHVIVNNFSMPSPSTKTYTVYYINCFTSSQDTTTNPTTVLATILQSALT